MGEQVATDKMLKTLSGEFEKRLSYATSLRNPRLAVADARVAVTESEI
jgi:hypothetical protein